MLFLCLSHSWQFLRLKSLPYSDISSQVLLSDGWMAASRPLRVW